MAATLAALPICGNYDNHIFTQTIRILVTTVIIRSIVQLYDTFQGKATDVITRLVSCYLNRNYVERISFHFLTISRRIG
jgi:hypothetical protein